MARTSSATVPVQVELPAETVGIEESKGGALASELRQLWVLEQVRRGRISAGKGAELSGLDRVAFARLLDEHGIPVMSYSVDDLRQDLQALDRP